MQPSTSSTRLKIEFAQASDPGRDPNKQVNEDSCGYADTKFGHLCVLCDGMGGHHGGKEASRLAITTIFQVMEQTPASVPPGPALKAAIEEAARRVYGLGGPPENRARPGSTVVAMVLHDRGVDVVHVGDSRAYVIRGNQIYPLTRDHSMVQGMIDAGLLTEASAMGHPDANKITRALGMKPEVDVEVRPETMELFNGDVLLQASDGLTDLALAADILGAARQAMNSGNLSFACNQLVQMANDRGGHDNITVQMARVLDAGPKASTTIPQSPLAGPGGAGAPASYAMGPQGPSSMASPQGPSSMASPHSAMGSPHSAAAPQLPPQRQLVSAGQPLGGAARVPETAPDSVHGGQHHGPGGVQWAPVPPTAADEPSGMIPTVNATAAGGVSPTMPGHGAQGGPDRRQGQYHEPAGLAAYRDGGPNALPLPPPSGRPYGAGSTQPPYSPVQFSHGPPSVSQADATPARGGIVFVIVGLSAFVAVMILLIIWALFLRA